YGGTATSPLFAAGTFDGTITLGQTPFINQGGLDVFLAKFDETSNITASATLGSPTANMDEDVRGIVTDANTNVFVVGTLRGLATLGGLPAQATGGDDVYVAKLDSNLSPQWFKPYGDGSDQGADAVAIAKDGGVIVAGHFQGTIDFGNGFK